MSKDLLPCATCPWRVDKNATTIPRYVHEKACGLLNTVGDADDFRQIMACHHSTGTEEPAEQICKGYLTQAGWTNINVRILMATADMPSPDSVADACQEAGIELEPDWETVLDKLTASLEYK